MPTPTEPIKPRTPGETRAYMEGQLAALKLAEAKGVGYARWIIEGAQKMMADAADPSSIK